MVRKFHDFKKASVERIHNGTRSLSETPIKWPLLFASISVEYCNTASVSSRTL